VYAVGQTRNLYGYNTSGPEVLAKINYFY
jgi:hypothetical protein